MTPERWRQVDELLDAALERPEAERAAFLAAACGDAELRGEVEALLAAHDRADSFTARPPVGLMREVTATATHPGAAEMPGRTLGRYRVISLLGKGGMGEVYLADDLALGRRVAVKILPAEMTRDKAHVRRFEREARAASALNHPNIVTIHEIGAEAGVHFIVTEYVGGETLRQRMGRVSFSVAEALEVIVQVAGALSAAHAAGIVHRDIKPENVMLREDGLVKVLDFGLAKRVRTPVAPEAVAHSLGSTADTSPGLVLGTLAYMSPEQARGQEVDARSDLFSLGVMLYELVAGRRPFTGATSSDVLAAVLTAEPPPVAEFAPGAPAGLQQILSRALAKKPEDRYQTGGEMLADLHALRRRLEQGATLRPAAAVQPTAGREDTRAGGSATTMLHTSSAAEILVSEIKRHKLGAGLALGLFALLCAAAALGVYQWLTARRPDAGPSFADMALTRLTTGGRVSNAALSPDGQYLIQALDEGGRSALQIKPVTAASGLQLVAPAPVRYVGLTFSRDGGHVYYLVEDREGDLALYQVGALGGQPRKILEPRDPMTPVTFAPDGRRFAYVRFHSATQTGALMVANADGTGEQTLVTRPYPEEMLWPAWSPDGRVIAFALAKVGGGGRTFDVVTVPSAGGEVKPLGGRKWDSIYQMAWLPDGGGLVMAAREPAARTRQLWLLAWPGGAARRVTNDLHEYTYVSVTKDSGAIAAVQTEQVSNLWVAPQGAAAQARQITFGLGQADGVRGVAWTPDGQIVYDSGDANSIDLLRAGPEGGAPAHLTANARANARPAVTADGRYVVFNSNRLGKSSIWRMDSDGGNLRQLTSDAEDAAPSVSPDGRWVVYQSAAEGKVVLKRVPLEGGAAELLTDRLAMRPAVSPDGATVACYHFNDSSKRWELGLLPMTAGLAAGPPKLIPLPPGAVNDIAARWSADGKSLFLVVTQDGVSNLWRQPVEGGAPKQVTDFKSQLIFSFDWSRDGRQLVCARGSIKSDAVLITGFRQAR